MCFREGLRWEHRYRWCLYNGGKFSEKTFSFMVDSSLLPPLLRKGEPGLQGPGATHRANYCIFLLVPKFGGLTYARNCMQL